MKTHVAIMDDSALMRETVANLVRSYFNTSVIEASSGTRLGPHENILVESNPGKARLTMPGSKQFCLIHKGDPNENVFIQEFLDQSDIPRKF